MRFWLKDSERRPDPTPASTDDRKVILIGMSVWVVALIALLFFTGPLAAAGRAWWVFTPAVALGLGLIGLVYVQVKRP